MRFGLEKNGKEISGNELEIGVLKIREETGDSV